jgi:ADP-L-glycero-D-manno-heptose 6-epimerase
MILLTGAAGFIGSVLLWKLNSRGVDDVIVVDKLHAGNKWLNLRKLRFFDIVDRDELFDWLDTHESIIDTVIHLGACTDTAEKNVDYFIKTNFEYSKKLWDFCSERKLPFLYASSAATYGAGEVGYRDDKSLVPDLLPLNPYGWSKQIFDRWVLKQRQSPPAWYGFKFFNVYGPNEYHKGYMASIIYHAFHQIKQKGTVGLFKSHRNDCKHGEQKRDFIYVKDAVEVLIYFLETGAASGIYNIGTGKARSFNDLAAAVFRALNREVLIEYIDMPENLRNQYQYFTEASVEKIVQAGYQGTIHDLEAGIEDYVKNYLNTDDPYL